jgi:hypothetical protein
VDFWTHLFDSEYHQRADIESLQKAARVHRMKRFDDLKKIESQENRIMQLEDRVGELALLCRSLLTVLRENGTVNPDKMMEAMIRIDAEDGVVDGKLNPPEPPEPPTPEEWPKIRTW